MRPIEVPVDWSDPEGPKLEVWASRALAEQQPATTQLWYLDGGPGGPGYGYRGALSLLEELLRASTITCSCTEARGSRAS
jgi:hypothetical protein